MLEREGQAPGNQISEIFGRYSRGLRGNKISEILVSGALNLALRTEFRSVRKVRKRLVRRNLFLYLIFVKICPNLIGKFYKIRYTYYRSC